MNFKDIADSMTSQYWQIEMVVVADNNEGTDLHFLIGLAWPNLVAGFCLLFQWRKLKRYVKSQLPEGHQFKLVLL